MSKDKKQDKSGYKSQPELAKKKGEAEKLLSAEDKGLPRGDVTEDEPVDFGAALSEVENSRPDLLSGPQPPEGGDAPNPGQPAGLAGDPDVTATPNFPGQPPVEATTGYIAPVGNGVSLEELEKQIESPVLGYDVVRASPNAVLVCAMICHNITKAYNDLSNEPTLPWEDNKASVISGVQAILNDPSLTPAQSHKLWMEYKEKEGWVYGEIKDPVAKTHPCMLPYGALPLAQKVKDTFFGVIVRTFFGL